MGVLRIILTVIYILICIALVILVLMQEGKAAGLGAISGAAETYWGKNKGRSMEGKLVKITTGLAVGFMFLPSLHISRLEMLRISRSRCSSGASVHSLTCKHDGYARKLLTLLIRARKHPHHIRARVLFVL